MRGPSGRLGTNVFGAACRVFVRVRRELRDRAGSAERVTTTPCGPAGRRRKFVWRVSGAGGDDGSYLVDPASSHMLVSKIKPCMSKHKPLHGEAANGSLGHP